SQTATMEVTGPPTRLPLSFEANEGQTDAQAQFLAHGRDYTIFLTAEGPVLSLLTMAAVPGLPAGAPPVPVQVPFHVNLVTYTPPQPVPGPGPVIPGPGPVIPGPNPGIPGPVAPTSGSTTVSSPPPGLGLDGLPGKANYLTLPDGPITDIPTYGEVH